MIICPNCKHKEMEGSLFCAECGAQLVELDQLATQSIRRISTGSLSPSRVAPPSTGIGLGQAGDEMAVSLHLLDTGQVIHLTGRKDYSLGRAADGQSTRPDVDLTPYDAYGQGVSRMHATIKINNQRVYITDLGSSNGTRVNGQKILPQAEYPLNHGDVVALGKLKIQFLIRK